MEKAKELLNNAEWLKSKYIDERLSRKTISNMLGVSESATRHYIEKFGLCKKELGVKSKYEVKHTGATVLLADREWLYEQYITMRKPARKIADELGVKYGRVDRWISSHGFYGLKTFKNICNEAKFCYTDPVFNYYAGLIATDGYVDRNSPRVSLRLSGEKDKEVLEELAKYFEFTGEIRKYRDSFDLTVSSPKLVLELSDRYGITNAKTFNVPFPSEFYNDTCARMYCRGVIDGDGYISKSGCFKLYCGSEIFVEGFISFLNKRFRWSIRKTYVQKKYPGFSLYGKRSMEFFDWIYSGIEGFRLYRKYERYNSLR